MTSLLLGYSKHRQTECVLVMLKQYTQNTLQLVIYVYHNVEEEEEEEEVYTCLFW